MGTASDQFVPRLYTVWDSKLATITQFQHAELVCTNERDDHVSTPNSSPFVPRLYMAWDDQLAMMNDRRHSELVCTNQRVDIVSASASRWYDENFPFFSFPQHSGSGFWTLALALASGF